MLFHDTPGQYLQEPDRQGLAKTIECSDEAIERAARFLNELDVLARNANFLEKNDEKLRRGALLPLANYTKRHIVGLTLWKTLFHLWEAAGKAVAESEQGPLFRFVTYVHSCVDLPEPKSDTLGDAVKKWKEGERQLFNGVPPPWQIGWNGYTN